MQGPGNAASRLDEITNLPTIPGILMEILGYLQDPNIGFDTLQKIVYKDPALTARILRIANSAYFGRKTPTNSLETAFLTVGINELVMIVSSIGVVNTLAKFGSKSFDRRILWKHSFMTGLVSRFFVRQWSLEHRTNNDEFIAGLLHDLGHIVISHYFPQEFVRVQAASATGPNPLLLEQGELGHDHAEISALIATRWRFSHSMIDVLRYHHDPETLPGERTLVRVVSLADRVCSWRAGDEPPISIADLLTNPEHLLIVFPGADQAVLERQQAMIKDLPREYERFLDLAASMDIV